MIKKSYLLAALSGILLWLAWPPIPYTTPLIFIALVPLLFGTTRIASSAFAKKGRHIFWSAFLCFFIFNVLTTYWVFNAISSGNNYIVSAFISLVPFGLGALLSTFPYWLTYRYRVITGGKYWLAFLAAACLSMEMLHASWELAFPWLSLGNSLSGMHQLAQWYDVTGVYGGSLWILTVNILVFLAIRHYRTHTGYMRWYALATLTVFLIPLALSLYKYYTFQPAGTLMQAVTVQPNIDPYQKVATMGAAEQVTILQNLTKKAATQNTELIVWPETALPYPISEDRIAGSAEYSQIQQLLAPYNNAALLTGLESYKEYNDQKTLSATFYPESKSWFDHFNAAAMFENSPKLQFYHKSKLVPGVEKMPFPQVLGILKPLFSFFGGSTGGYGWQTTPGVFYTYSGVGVTPVICYESIWGNWIARSVKAGSQLIAVITNDGWWGNTSGKNQHFLYARLRAIENRRYVVRSANTGISGFINQRGDIEARTQWWKPAVLAATVRVSSFLTPYTQNGDIIGWLGVVTACVFALYTLAIRFAGGRLFNKKNTDLV